MSISGIEKVSLEGDRSIYMTSEDQQWHAALLKRRGPKGLRGGQDSKGDGPNPLCGFAGWVKRVNSVKAGIGKKVMESNDLGSTEDPGNPGGTRSETSAVDSINRSFQKIHPMTQMNDHVKERLKTYAKQNARKIAASIVELAVYTTVFHHAKQGLKYATRGRKYTGTAVRYASDVVLPDPLFGPIFGVLLRLKLPF